jgi:hypothetical protein
MRSLVILIAVVVMIAPGLVSAQSARFSVAVSGCADPGDTVVLRGAGMGRQETGTIALRQGRRALPMPVRRWSDRSIRAQVPRQRVEAGKSYEVVWIVNRRVAASFGDLEICGSAQPERRSAGGRPARADEVPAPNGSPEYIVATPVAQANAAAAALQAQGGQLLRRRNLPNLGRVTLFFALPGNLSLAQAQAILDAAANGARIDLHNIYGFAEGPRLYAASAIGDGVGEACRLRSPVRVGIIDGPVDSGHSGLRGAKVTRANFLERGDRSPSPDHGTAVAALIGGTGAGSVTGFAPGANLFAANAFTVDRGRSGAELENLAAALDWLAGNRVSVVNMSFAGRGNSAFQDLITAAARQGMVMVAATGNSGDERAAYPAGAPEVIAVTAVDASGKLYGKATRGRHVEFAAPGVQVWTAKGSSGGYQTGTSFAAPIVAALIAREAARGRIGASAARKALQRNARDLGAAGRDSLFGWGLVQSGGC